MSYLNPLIPDIQAQYENYRAVGKSRTDAIGALKIEYKAELDDEDSAVFVLCALVLALCKKKELTEEIAEEAKPYIQKALNDALTEAPMRTFLNKVAQLLLSDNMYGEEAKYALRRPYNPGWEVGDLFAHTLMHPSAERLGISGWTILLYKVGEHVDEYGKCRQLMYVTLCPPEKEPISATELQKIGFLRVMCHDRKWDYMVQIIIRGKKDKESYQLRKIGNFVGISKPTDSTKEDPLVSMPLFGRITKESPYPDYEEHICRLYKKYGIAHNTGE